MNDDRFPPEAPEPEVAADDGGVRPRPRPVRRLTSLPVLIGMVVIAFFVVVLGWVSSRRADRPEQPGPQEQPAVDTPTARLQAEAERDRLREAPPPARTPPPAPPEPERDQRSPQQILVAEFNNPPPGLRRFGAQQQDEAAPRDPRAAYAELLSERLEAAREERAQAREAMAQQNTDGAAAERPPGYGPPGYDPVGYGGDPGAPFYYRDELYAADQAQRFLDDTRALERSPVRPTVRIPAATPYEVKAGTLVPAILETQINSDLPGSIRARVRQDVYDSTRGQHLLIPRGSTLLGMYSNRVVWGERRVLVAFTRLIFPDGSYIPLDSELGTDALGASGFHDLVNNHYFRLFGNALMVSLISAGVTYSADELREDRTGFRFDAADELALSLGREMGRVFTQLFRRNLNIAPTLETRPGFLFNVFITSDLAFRAPYQPLAPVTR